ncbi:UNVERIFIED_CONTAM: thiamine-phosphate pyrophosphorylase [Acetivibrio alkalicellulosi]
MDKLYRIIDANINRASEGVRVLEDLARFYYNDKNICGKLKEIRHGIRKEVMSHLPSLLDSRDSHKDVGLEVSKELKIDSKTSMIELITANFKRLQEALRAIEENLKVLNLYQLSKSYEDFRFSVYQLEKEFFKLEMPKRKIIDLKGLYCITAHEFSNGRSNIEVVEKMINSGAKIIQYREKYKSHIEKYKECVKLREMTKESDVIFILNDHIDIAMMVKADGVHLGQDDLPVEKVRELVGEDMIIGLSTHSPKQAQAALSQGVDYIGVGPIYKTYTKKDVCDPVGLEYLEYVVKNIDLPYVAIGGIKEHNLSEVLSKGAKCVAMVTEIVGADDIEGKIEKVKISISKGVL